MPGTQKAITNSPTDKAGPSERQRLKKIIKSVLLDRPDSETRLQKSSTSSAANGESTPAAAQATHKAEDAPQRQPGSSDDGEVNLTAANLWNRLFKSKNYVNSQGTESFSTRS